MTLSTWFWVIYVLSILGSYWFFYEPNTPWFKRAGSYGALWILVGILGYQVFGSVVK